MSVIGLNLWINFQVLKSTHQQLKIYAASQIRELKNQVMHYQQSIVSKLLAEISYRDEIINQSKRKQESASIVTRFSEPQKEIEWANSETHPDGDGGMKIMSEKLQEVLNQNKQYEAQFAALIDEMKTIKIYVEELKKVKSMKYIEGSLDDDSPAKKLSMQEDHLLTKISSLNRLQQIKIPCPMDTIRQVTQMSPNSDQELDQLNGRPQEFHHQFLGLINNCHIAESHSFECTNQIQDITNMLFDNNSQDVKEAPNGSQCYETFQYSLSVLKNYCGNTEQEKWKIDGIFALPNVDVLVSPVLKLKQIVNERHLIFHHGFTYTGNTVRGHRNELIPMGFGQLYQEGRLVYCGSWKNGLFDGWGRMYCPENSEIRGYNGKWKEGYAWGSGSIFFWNCDKFMGSLVRSEIRGDGTYFRNNRPARRGYWENNRLVIQEA